MREFVRDLLFWLTLAGIALTSSVRAVEFGIERYVVVRSRL